MPTKEDILRSELREVEAYIRALERKREALRRQLRARARLAALLVRF